MPHPEENLCNENTFNTFYIKYVEDAFNFMFYRCGNRDQSLDLVQEAFIKIWDNCSSINFSKAKSYLFTTANNLFLNQVKHQKVVLEYAKLKPVKDSSDEDPEFILREKEQMKRLQNAIANLTDAQREVFLLNRIDGKKYREIADMLNISVKAVEKRMMGALSKLREQFDYFNN